MCSCDDVPQSLCVDVTLACACLIPFYFLIKRYFLVYCSTLLKGALRVFSYMFAVGLVSGRPGDKTRPSCWRYRSNFTHLGVSWWFKPFFFWCLWWWSSCDFQMDVQFTGKIFLWFHLIALQYVNKQQVFECEVHGGDDARLRWTCRASPAGTPDQVYLIRKLCTLMMNRDCCTLLFLMFTNLPIWVFRALFFL